MSEHIVEDRESSRQAFVVVRMRAREPVDQHRNARRFGSIEFLILEIDVVDDLGDGTQAGC
ncbi:MAG TPA: hypothetical protein VF331_02215, partial [Polyangiales bacterium]